MKNYGKNKGIKAHRISKKFKILLPSTSVPLTIGKYFHPEEMNTRQNQTIRRTNKHTQKILRI